MSIQSVPEDPYAGPEETAESEDLITRLFSWTGKAGLFSTWRERHIFARGLYQGVRLGVLDKLPDCPPYWNDEGQYYEGGCEIGYFLRVALMIALVNTAGGLAVLKLAGAF
jgi:hypothetical protein